MAQGLSSVHILGAGTTGSLAALSLAEDNRHVVLHDPQTAEGLKDRSRAYAITHSSRRLLQKLDLWRHLGDSLTSFDLLDLRDQSVEKPVLYHLNDLPAAHRSSGGIGWILDHAPLMNLMLMRLKEHANVELFLGNPSPSPGPNDLVVAADGPRSSTRESWGIGRWQHNYRQGCLTAKVAIRGVNRKVAYELFRTEGPLAVLPLGQGNFQVVWSASLHKCRQRCELPGSIFLDQLAAVLPSGLEPDRLLDSPRAFPQQLMLAHRLSAGRGVLIGEAGHRYHPVAGQGLNLCWRDVETLLQSVRAGGSPASIARRYGQRRWMDLLLVGLFTDLLVRVFSNRNRFLLPLRRLVIGLLALSSTLRRLSLRAMSDGPMQMLQVLSD